MGAKPASMHRAIRQGFGVLLNGMGAKQQAYLRKFPLGFGVLLNGMGAKHDDLQFESA